MTLHRPPRARAPLATAAALALAFTLAGCKEDLSVAPPANLTCATGTCPEGWTCNRRLSLCIFDAAIDREPPALHDPQVVPTRSRAFQPTTVSFDVSEPLGVPPRVTLAGGAAFTLVTPQVGQRYVYRYLPSGSEPEEAPQAVTIAMEDLQANETTAAGGFLVFDFTRPSLDLRASSVPGDPLALGATLTVSVRVTEPLAQPPRVRLANATAPGGDFEEVGRSGNDWSFRYVTTDAAFPAGAGEVTQTILVDLEDLVGNRAEGLVLGQARFDRRPPSLSVAATLSRAFAGQGKEVSISFSLDEDLAALPVVTLDGPGSPAFDVVAEPASAGRRAFVATRIIQESDGAGAHVPHISVVDRAGNAALLVAPELVLNFQKPTAFAVSVCPSDGFDPNPCPSGEPSLTLYGDNPGFQQFKFSFTPPPEFLSGSVMRLHWEEALTVTLEPTGAASITIASVRSAPSPTLPDGSSPTTFTPGPCSITDAAWVCHWSVTPPRAGQERQDLLLRVAVTGRSGNVATGWTPLTYDYRKPALEGAALVSRCDEYAPAKRDGRNAYWLRPLRDIVTSDTRCPYNPGCSAGPSGSVQVFFDVDEELGRLAGGALAASVYLRRVGSSALADAADVEPLHVATCTAPTVVKAYLTRDPALGAGELELAAQLTDRAGNRSAPLSLGRIRPLPVPGAPAAGLGGHIRYIREPWGPAGQAADVTPRYTIHGAAGAVTSDPPADVLALIVDGGGMTTLDPIAATSTGAFTYPLPTYAGSTVWIRQRDRAGSVGPPALVQDVTVVARPGPAFPLRQQSWWRPARDVPASAAPIAPALPADLRGEPRLERLQAGVTPEASGYCTAAFWPERGTVVRFGGFRSLDSSRQSYAFSGTTVAWDGASWSPVATAPADLARASAAMAYDAARGRLVLFGGLDRSWNNRSDTWELGAAGWTRVCEDGACGIRDLRGPWDTTGLRGATAFYDPVLRSVVLYGGREQGFPWSGRTRDETYAWNGTTWTRLYVAGPAARGWPLVATAPDGRTLLASGSSDYENAVPVDDAVWLWTTLDNGTRGWAGKGHPSDGPTIDYRKDLLWWDASYGAFLLYRPSVNELWQWQDDNSPKFVRAATPSVPPEVRDALQAGVFARCAAYDPHRRELVRFGGCAAAEPWVHVDSTCTDPLGDTFTFTAPAANAPAAWHRVLHPRAGPAARSDAALAFSPARTVGGVPVSGSAWLLGGAGGAGVLDDAWRWDGAAWSAEVATAGLRGAGLAAWGTSGILVRTAGVGPAHAGARSSTAVLEQPGATAWDAGCATTICADPIPVGSVDDPAFAASGQSLVSFTGPAGGAPTLLFHRGADGATWLGQLDPLGPSSVAWTPVPAQPTDAPTSVRGHRMSVCTRTGSADTVVLFGGVDAGGRYLPDTFTWDAVRRTWVKQSSAGPPRADHAQFCDPVTGNVVVIGGFDGHPLADVWEWDGSTWTQRQPPERPSARTGAAAAVGGPDHAILFGGVAGGAASDETWVWRGGGDARPAHTLALTVGGIWDAPGRLQTVEVSWAGGASARAANGAQLHAWLDGAWRPVGAATAAGAAGGGVATWTASREALTPFLTSSAVALDLACAPVGVNGAGAATLRTSWVDVAVRYRACVPRGQRALAGDDCCAPAALSGGRCP